MKKKICFPFIGDSFGGSHKSTLILIKQLQGEKIETIIFLHKKGKLYEILKSNKIKFYFYPIKNYFGTSKSKVLNLIYLFLLIPFLMRLILKHKINIIHSNDMKIHLNWIIPTLLLKKKFIWHQRTTLPDSRVVRRLIKLASKIISISNFVKNSIPMSLENKIKVIYNPIENSNKSKIKKVKFINKNKQILIGSFSNLQSIKQPEILIQIAEILKKKNTQYKICSFGDDKEKLFNNFKKIIIKKDLRKFIEFYGFQYPIEPWILKIDMIIATSLNDGFGRTILEGMFLRKPVIASNAGGHREIIEQNINGVLVEKSLPYEYFKAIEKIAKNSRFRKKIIKNGFEKSQDFSIQKIISDVVKIYE